MTTAQFAAYGVALTAAHEFADHWIQTDGQAAQERAPAPARRT